jgi:peptidyl-prolyl cis-trans isomerase D
MLRGIHKATSNWLGRIVTGVLLGLIALSFAVWGVGDIFRGFGRSTVATIGKAEINIDQFRQLYNERLQQLARQIGRPVTADQARLLGLDRQLLQQMLAEMALDQNARQLGLGLSDAEIAKGITGEAMFRGPTGQFDRARFEQVIRQAGYTEARYVAEQRRLSLRREITETITGDLTVPKLALEAQNRYENEQRGIEYVVLGPAQAGDIPAPAPEVLTKYFEERKVLFRAPEYRKVTLLTVTPSELARSTEISDADVKAAYERRRTSYVTSEKRQLQQIVFPSADEARAAAEKIAAGTDFAAVAAERGIQEKDLNLGSLTKAGILDSIVADAAFALTEGTVSAPIQGRFGISLVRVVKIEPEQVRSFETVASELKQELALEAAKSQISVLHDKIEDERASGQTLAEAAQKLKLEARTIEAVDRSGRAPDGNPVAGLPNGLDIVGNAFAADVGVETDPLQVSGGGYVWYEVLGVTPSRERTLDEVKDQVEARWRETETAARLKAKADEIVMKLPGSTWSEVVSAAGLKSEIAFGLKRGKPTEIIPAAVLEQIFRTPKDGAGSAEGSGPAARIVFRVTDLTVPPLDAEATDIKRIRDIMRSTYAEDLLSQYVLRLESNLGTSINESVLSEVRRPGTN